MKPEGFASLMNTTAVVEQNKKLGVVGGGGGGLKRKFDFSSLPTEQ